MLPYAVLVVGVLCSILSALAMRDHVRLVDIVGLFASGVGTGAGIVAAIVQQRARHARPAGRATP